jgi:hypothetical protein
VWDYSVSLFWLLDFVKNRKGVVEGLSTQDVVNKIIIPETAQKKLRYVELIPDSCVSSPTYVVTHVWSAPFLDLIGSLQQYFNLKNDEDKKSIYLWIDIFAINQHGSDDKANDLKNLQVVIKNASSGTLICMDAHGKLLSRYHNC